MADRYDITSPRPGKDKTFWFRIGTAFQREKGGYMIHLDALPIADKEGKVTLLMTPSKPKDTGLTDGQFKKVREAAGEKTETEIDDQIPF